MLSYLSQHSSMADEEVRFFIAMSNNSHSFLFPHNSFDQTDFTKLSWVFLLYFFLCTAICLHIVKVLSTLHLVKVLVFFSPYDSHLFNSNARNINGAEKYHWNET